MGFDILGLSEGTLKAVASSGYTEPTPIQIQAIPQVLMGKDILGIAQTGTGKTASFTLPLIDILSEGRARARMPRTLILEPTRELAAQVADAFTKYGKNTKLSMALLIGGVNFSDQEKLLDRGVDVLIATPGRLLDHFSRGKLLLNGIDILIVDEADRMLDMGFIPDVEEICSKITKKHQTLFFSATMPPPIERLAQKFLIEPKMIEVAPPSSTAKTITQSVMMIDGRRKRKLLRGLLKQETITNGIIFCNRKKDVKDVYASLQRHDFNVGQLHGDMAQAERLQVLDGFKSGNIQLLVASDVAARGLDIPGVSHVFNFDVPSHAEDYVHRIGRTGRAGREGISITLARPGIEDEKYLKAIAKLTGEATPLRDVPKDILKDPASPRRSRQAKSDAKPEQPISVNEATDIKDAPVRETTDRISDAPANRTPQSLESTQTRIEKRSQGPSENRNETRQDPPRQRSRQHSYDRSERSSSGLKFARDDWPKEPVIGMGPHVPAFLEKPVRLSK